MAGCDVHLRENLARATVIVMRFPELEVVETVHGEIAIDFPYVPGLLSWRELPPLLTALRKLSVRPDLLMADGQGLAHPCRFGLACHLGLATGLPTLGCAKSILRGNHEPVGEEKGSSAPLVYRGQVVGMALRSKDRVKLLYISVGHLITLDEAVEYVLRCCLKHRLPEPNRLAHVAAQSWARGEVE
ncbi:MAG: endonuclease V [Thermomicrobiales bacterium]